MTQNRENVIHEALRRFETGQTDFEEVFDANGIRNLIIRDQADPRFFRIEAEGPNKEFVVTATGMRVPPADHRPKVLPSQVPFLPGATTTVLIMPATGSTVVRWESPGNLEGSFRELRAGLMESGWEEVESDLRPDQGPRKSIFLKDGRNRSLVAFDTPERQDLVLTEEASP